VQSHPPRGEGYFHASGSHLTTALASMMLPCSVTNQHGATALHMAALRGSVGIISELLGNGVRRQRDSCQIAVCRLIALLGIH